MPHLHDRHSESLEQTALLRPTHTHTVRPVGLAWWIVRPSVLVAAALLGTGCAEETDLADDVIADVRLESAPQIFGGEEDADEVSIDGVVALKIGSGSGEVFELCTGALVAPNVVLTARHCIARSVTTSVSCNERGLSKNGPHVAGHFPADEVAVYTGAAPKFNQRPDARGTSIVAPTADSICDSDIALVVLDQTLDVSPLPVRLDGSAFEGESIRAVGYGQNDRALPLGTRLRKPGVQVLSVGSGVSPSKTALGHHEFEVGHSICQGDSGGPAISEETGAVIGVVSRGGDCRDHYGHIYTATAGFAALFDEAFALADAKIIEESGAYLGNRSKPHSSSVPTLSSEELTSAPSCAVGHVSPSAGAGTSGILALACVTLLRVRSRRAARTARSAN